MMIRTSILLLPCFIILSCGSKNKAPSDILPAKKMQEVFWDILQTDAFTTYFQSKDSSKQLPLENVKLQQQVFALHNISKETFYKSYTYYKEHNDLMKGILDSMITKANRDRGNPNRFTQPVRLEP